MGWAGGGGGRVYGGGYGVSMKTPFTYLNRFQQKRLPVVKGDSFESPGN